MMKIKVITQIFVLFLIATSAFAMEFQHFKLKGELKQKALKKKKALKSASKLAQKTNNRPQMSPILQEISDILTGEYQNIGEDQTRRLLDNHDIGGGVLNFSGFTWYKPMLNYNISANREVAPELFSDRWIVHDSFTIFIDAATLLSNLKKENKIVITNNQLGAFAGITFKRTYHYYHFADTYFGGLTSDFSKLFLSFLKFTHQEALNISEYEVIKKSDHFTFNAGGLVKAPLGSGIDLQAGVLVKTAYKNEILLQSVGIDDQPKQNEFLRLSIDKTYDTSAKAHLSLQYDFFKLLKLELFSSELEYEFAKSNKTYLSFYQSDKKTIQNSQPHADEFSKLLNGKDEINNWIHNIEAVEQREKENYNSKYSFLIFGNMKKRATEQIKIIRDGIEKIFFKNYSESIKYVQSLLSRLFSDVIMRIFDFKSKVNNKAELRKNLIFEYEKIDNLATATVDKEDKLSIKLKYYFQVNSTQNWYEKKYKKSAQKYTKRFTTLPRDISNKIKNNELQGPIVLNSSVEIGFEAIEFFNQLDRTTVIQTIINVCGLKKREYKDGSFIKKRYRKGRSYKKGLSSRQQCAKKLFSRYDDYIENYVDLGVINIVKLKKFLGYYFSKSKSLNQITALFSEDYVFIHGDFRAKTKLGNNFQTFFKSGQFRGLGVIDNFKKQKMITPISAD